MMDRKAIAPPQCDYLRYEEVAARLGKSVRWLQNLLTEDDRRPPGARRFHFHDYVGRTRTWTESQFQSLVSAINAAARERKGLRDSISFPAPGTGTLSGRSALVDVRTASERVQAFSLTKSTGRQQTPPASRAKRKSAPKSSKGSGRASHSRLRLISTST